MSPIYLELAKLLLRARAELEPNTLCQIELPNGGTLVGRGAALIAYAEQHAAMEATATAPRLAVLATRVGAAAGPVPPGYQTADCSWCSAPVWLSA